MNRTTKLALTPASAFAVILAAFGSPVPGAAQEPTLAALLAEAEADNPEIVAAQRAAEAATAQVLQAGALPDPRVGVSVMNVPVATPGLAGDVMTMTTVQLGEQFPWPGKLALREEIARFHAEAAEWEVERVRAAVLSDVRSAYYRVYFLNRALEVTARNELLISNFARLTSAQYAVGTAVQPDVLKAQVERTRLTDQVRYLEQAAAQR